MSPFTERRGLKSIVEEIFNRAAAVAVHRTAWIEIFNTNVCAVLYGSPFTERRGLKYSMHRCHLPPRQCRRSQNGVD